MITGIYTIYDKVLKQSCPVFSSKNDAVAIRQTNNLLKSSPDTEAKDYVLYKLGEYDDESLILASHKKIKIDYKTVIEEIPEIENKGILTKIKETFKNG
ncbi:MAG: nonstructural protein [Arizlama microvirus]|nr:MAG: nonstructural protein [Arizlama microvirus]